MPLLSFSRWPPPGTPATSSPMRSAMTMAPVRNPSHAGVCGHSGSTDAHRRCRSRRVCPSTATAWATATASMHPRGRPAPSPALRWHPHLLSAHALIRPAHWRTRLRAPSAAHPHRPPSSRRIANSGSKAESTAGAPLCSSRPPGSAPSPPLARSRGICPLGPRPVSSVAPGLSRAGSRLLSAPPSDPRLRPAPRPYRRSP